MSRVPVGCHPQVYIAQASPPTPLGLPIGSVLVLPAEQEYPCTLTALASLVGLHVAEMSQV